MARSATISTGNASRASRNVRFMRDEIKERLEEYKLIEDCIHGEVKIKKGRTKYLPQPDAQNTSAENIARYDAYLVRAVFYNATRRTLAGLLGEIFAIDPVYKIPPQLQPTYEDATGGGVSAVQQAIVATHNVLAYSRAGLWVDFPQRPTVKNEETGEDEDRPITIEEVESGNFYPLIYVYEPWRVINWRNITRGSRVLLSLVVIEEDYEAKDDGFEIKTEKRWRVLRLDERGEYSIEIWYKDAAEPQSRTYPTDSTGKRLNEIPFKFVGARNNDANVDPPLLYDLASLNIAHYRNSADLEESSFVVGQPTYYFTGLTERWVKDIIGSRVETGARAAIPLPEKATAGILQPDPNTMAKDGMDQKEKQMVALGAKLVENRSVQRTASEATMDQRTENSILATAANNVSQGFEWAFEQAAMFAGGAETDIEFELNTEFAIDKLAPEDQAQIIATWMAGGISFTEMRYLLRKASIATETDAVAKAEIEKDQEKKLKADTEAKVAVVKAKPAGEPAAGGTTNPTGAT